MKFLFILFTLFFSTLVTTANAKSVSADEALDADAVGIQTTQKNKNQFLMRDCPVVGNTQSGIYHLPGQPNYNQMLIVNKCSRKAKKSSCKDNRRCFDSEAEALDTDFCTSPNSCRKYRKSTSTIK